MVKQQRRRDCPQEGNRLRKEIFSYPLENPFTIALGLCRISAHGKKDTISCVSSDTIYYMLFVLTFIYLFAAHQAEPYGN